MHVVLMSGVDGRSSHAADSWRVAWDGRQVVRITRYRRVVEKGIQYHTKKLNHNLHNYTYGSTTHFWYRLQRLRGWLLIPVQAG